MERQGTDGRMVMAGLWAVAVVLAVALVTTILSRSAARPDSGSSWDLASGLSPVGHWARLSSRNQAGFEGGNIGAVVRTGPTSFELRLRSDNDDALPKFWRQWWYLRLDGVPTDRPVTLTLKGAGQWHYYLPVFSYDGERQAFDDRVWRQFSEGEVTKPTRLTLTMTRRFTQPTVWLARYVPYTYSRLLRYLAPLEANRDVTVASLGLSPQGRKIPFITITNKSSTQPKQRVLIHARTHPGEVGSSFLLEGLIDELLSDRPLARRLRERLVFDIVPMLNVDGVVVGNNRVTPQGLNLEGKWYTRPGQSFELDPDRAPLEVRLWWGKIRELLRDGTPVSPVSPVSMALNLHSSGGEPRDNMFFFPHFGPASKGYDQAEQSLFGKQLAFIRHFVAAQGARWFNRPPAEGTRGFLARSLPESWWWHNFKDQVMALSIESTYGRAGPEGRWMTPADMRRLGASMAQAIARYHGIAAGKH